ncbi:MAG: sulfite reductase subunit alpha [Gammaproteobacteria bacterium]|nr:MAG: sulfite reductase subunit alpha [Gammaproteobacteria bacterium]
MKKLKLPFSGKDLPLSDGQRVWLDGLLSGFSQQAVIRKDFAEDMNIGLPLAILYGSQTGNAESVAYACAEMAKNYGLTAQVIDMGDIEVDDLSAIERLLIVTSTYGEGEMPDNAESLWQAISADDALKLPQTFFSVLALGDTAYDEFCEAGKLWDERLEQLGAKRIAERVDCDVDFEDDAEAWSANVLPIISQKGSQKLAEAPQKQTAKVQSQYTRKNPLLATLITKKTLTSDQSGKEIVHYEFDLGDSGETYQVGGMLNVLPRNHNQLVEELLAVLKADAGDSVTWREREITLGELFSDKLEIRNPSIELVQAIAERSDNTKLLVLLDQREQLEDFIYGKDIVYLLNRYPAAAFDAESLLPLLKPLSPRAYSISSSLNKHDKQVHLTVGSVRYTLQNKTILCDRQYLGVCSTWLADSVAVGDEVPCYFSPNKHFTVPQDDNCPMIMVGPGTGIAPFRAFLEEREVRGASGDNWLFFGDREEKNDFIYREELLSWQQSGLLTRLDLAFSRDQAEKIYVQTRMAEHGKALFEWLQRGAYFYVCGDASRMAKDVDKTLHQIIAEYGGLNDAGAKAYVEAMKKAKRYVRDVY